MVHTNKKSSVHSRSDISFNVVPNDFMNHWSRCGNVSDFLAHFQSYNYEHRKRVAMVLSTIFNELLENAIKYSADKYKPVKMSLDYRPEQITVSTLNTATRKQAEKFKAFIEELASKDPEEMFLDKILTNAESGLSESCLGLINIKKDFNADFNVTITPSEDKDLFNIHMEITLNNQEIK